MLKCSCFWVTVDWLTFSAILLTVSSLITVELLSPPLRGTMSAFKKQNVSSVKLRKTFLMLSLPPSQNSPATSYSSGISLASFSMAISLRGPMMTIGRLKLAGGGGQTVLRSLKLAQLITELGHEQHEFKKPTFSEQDSLIGREFALNGELQQVITGPTDVLFVLLVPSEPP